MVSVDIFDSDNSDGTIIDTGEEILAYSTVQIDATVKLPTYFTDTYEIKIGNEYVGYYHYYLRSSESSRTILGFSVIGVVLAVVGTSIYLLTRRRK
jgi:hypothetical protein